MAHGRKTGGRQAGTPNKATRDARRSIALLLEGNVDRLEEWMTQVASGIRETSARDQEAEGRWVVRPNPAKAFEMFQSLLEFHVPKLTRVHVSSQDVPTDSPDMTIFDEILKSLLAMRSTGTRRMESRHTLEGLDKP